MKTSCRSLRLARALPLLAAALAVTPHGSAADAKRLPTLEHALLERSPNMIRALKKDREPGQPAFVGVLKFLVVKGKKRPSDNVGPFNLSMAERLEKALVLAVEKDDNLVVLRQASADLPPRANHLTPRGRKALFDQVFPGAWGDDKKHHADVLLSGVAELRPDRRSLDVQILAMDRRHPDQNPTVLDHFQTGTDLRVLTELGESYLRPRDLVEVPDEPEKPQQPQKTALVFAYGEDTAKPTQVLEQSPVSLEILYNGKRKSIRVGDDRLEVDEPAEGTQVQFRLTNKSKDRYGVVLKVNGENTIARESLLDCQCHKWVLDPGDSFLVKGFQTDDATGPQAQSFVVLPDDESAVQRVRYGKHAGTFTLVLFREQKKSPPAPTESPERQKGREKEEALVQSVAQLDAEPPQDLDSLKQSILKTGKVARNASKGLVVAGAARRSSVKTVDFQFNPDPVLSATIYYYKPRNLIIPAIGQP
jgi:hypothetical protein